MLTRAQRGRGTLYKLLLAPGDQQALLNAPARAALLGG
jgi:hypothetical protein